MVGEVQSPQHAAEVPQPQPQGLAIELAAGAPSPEPTPTSGRRLALQGLRRELSEEDLKSPGAHKMLLDALESSDAQAETLRGYEVQFHVADKRAAVLEEKLKTH